MPKVGRSESFRNFLIVLANCSIAIEASSG
jgi:hypothetical protein